LLEQPTMMKATASRATKGINAFLTFSSNS
jgi:hypothetical protein